MKGKRTLLLIVVGVVTFCLLLGFLQGYDAVWSIWKITPLKPHFGDLRNLTSGAESIAMGYDPLYFNPQDPWERPLNQPRLVQYIVSALKLNQSHTTLIGILFILLFFLGVFISLKQINNLTALVLAVVIFSPAVMFGIERGNHDLFIFFLVSAALFLSNFPIISMLILLLAALIKIFPVFALSYFFKYKKRTQLVVLSGFLIPFVIYILLNSGDWKQVYNSTLKGYGIYAYGTLAYSKPSASFEYGKPAGLTAYIPFLAIVINTFIFYINSIYEKGFKQGNDSYIDTFRAGAGIYIGTFFLGNTWLYRLMFLIFVVPQLISWTSDAKRGFISLIALISLIVSCWSLWGASIISERWIFLIDELCNWVLFTTLFYLFLSSMPLFLQRGLVAFVSLTHLCSRRMARLWQNSDLV